LFINLTPYPLIPSPSKERGRKVFEGVNPFKLPLMINSIGMCEVVFA